MMFSTINQEKNECLQYKIAVSAVFQKFQNEMSLPYPVDKYKNKENYYKRIIFFIIIIFLNKF